MKRFVILLITVLALHINSEAQSIGVTLGGGFFSGNSPNISSFTSSIFINSPPLFNNAFSLRLSFLYNADYNQLLPNSTNQYNPFIKGFSLKGIINQDIDPNYYLDEGIGLLVLDDRVFSGIDATDYGIVISVGAGIDLRKSSPSGFRIGAGTDYAFTFTNTYAKYFSVHLTGQYFF
jgi:hypothetical protein